MSKYLFILLAFPIVFASCNGFYGRRVRGNGHIKTEDRSVGDFKNVSVGGSFAVHVSQGAGSSVKIEGDENLLPLVEVTHEGDKLEIRTKSGFNLHPSKQMNVWLTAPVYSDIDVSGACDIIGDTKITNPENMQLHVSGAGDIKMEIDAPALSAEVSGSGSIYLKGQTKDVDLGISGAGHAHCYDLLAENTKIEISGAGGAQVFASVKLDAEVSGAGNVSYKGNPTSVNQHVSGAGSVSKEN